MARSRTNFPRTRSGLLSGRYGKDRTRKVLALIQEVRDRLVQKRLESLWRSVETMQSDLEVRDDAFYIASNFRHDFTTKILDGCIALFASCRTSHIVTMRHL